MLRTKLDIILLVTFKVTVKNGLLFVDTVYFNFIFILFTCGVG